MSRHSDEENLDFVVKIYEYVFQCFTRRSCVLPSFDFNLADLKDLKILKIVLSVPTVDLVDFLPSEFLIHVKGCSQINFVLGILKTVVCGSVSVLAAYVKFFSLSAPISYRKVAVAREPKDWERVISSHEGKKAKKAAGGGGDEDEEEDGGGDAAERGAGARRGGKRGGQKDEAATEGDVEFELSTVYSQH